MKLFASFRGKMFKKAKANVSAPEAVIDQEKSSESRSFEEIYSTTEDEVSTGWWVNPVRNAVNKIFFGTEVMNDFKILSGIQARISLSQKKDIELFAKLVIDNGLIEVAHRKLKTSLKEFIESENFARDYFLMELVMNCCNESPVMCKAIVSNNLHGSIIKILGSPFMSVQKINDMPNAKEALVVFFGTLHNLLRGVPDCREEFREQGVLEVSLEYLEASDSLIKTFALFVLTFSVDVGSDRKSIEATTSNIKFILDDCLKPAMQSDTHDANGWSVQEIMQALSLLSENSENATEMAILGLLDLCEIILEEKYSEAEMKFSLDTIWSMSFLPDLRNRLRKCESLRAYIEKLKLNANEGVSKSAAGILWNLKHLDQELTQVCGSPSHVMISYSWEQKSLAWQIKENLVEVGRKVWIDTKNMEGDVFDAMAEAVENASHVICCISEDYASSRFCRLEAVNAWKKKKPMIFAMVQEGYHANGWLEFIMSGSFYYDMHSIEVVDKNFRRLFNLLQDKTLEENEDLRKDKEQQQQPKTHRAKGSLNQIQCTSWSDEDVKEWFKSTGCSASPQLLDFLDTLDGLLLQELCLWQRNAPEFFLKFAKEELKFEPICLIKFSYAVTKLSESS